MHVTRTREGDGTDNHYTSVFGPDYLNSGAMQGQQTGPTPRAPKYPFLETCGLGRQPLVDSP